MHKRSEAVPRGCSRRSVSRGSRGFRRQISFLSFDWITFQGYPAGRSMISRNSGKLRKLRKTPESRILLRTQDRQECRPDRCICFEHGMIRLYRTIESLIGVTLPGILEQLRKRKSPIILFSEKIVLSRENRDLPLENLFSSLEDSL